ncbi:hypothetical protein EAL2_c09070 [Peptoclostridium acidaminophilum DSM 3953]|uniref:Uncharacterized protein n=1 Tax=Peptoclostridium acidaminophilum DSM 3953 TaxID=1286171 RepID=W8TJ38_PEPAC|nr:hypothetical protein EAL2_c09070 [Peptoclostridium acidaminophilum DSM 3953]
MLIHNKYSTINSMPFVIVRHKIIRIIRISTLDLKKGLLRINRSL